MAAGDAFITRRLAAVLEADEPFINGLDELADTDVPRDEPFHDL